MPVKTKGEKQAVRAKRDAQRRADNRPWWDKATDRDFWTPDPGTYTIIVTGLPVERISNYGKPVLDIPTNKGVLSSGSFSLIRPLAKVVKAKGNPAAVIGGRLTFTATGTKQARRYENVSFQL